MTREELEYLVEWLAETVGFSELHIKELKRRGLPRLAEAVALELWLQTPNEGYEEELRKQLIHLHNVGTFDVSAEGE
jgi:hypothetical protein